MGTPQDSTRPGAAGTPFNQLKQDPHPRHLEAIQTGTGHWWLVWNGNPELTAYGQFPDSAAAEAFKARLVRRREEHDARRAHPGDDLAAVVEMRCRDIMRALGYQPAPTLQSVVSSLDCIRDCASAMLHAAATYRQEVARDDLRPGVISDTAKKPRRQLRVLKRDLEAQALVNALEAAEVAGREAGVKEARQGDPCCALAPEKCRDDLSRAAWCNGYINGWSSIVRAQEVAHA